MGEDLEDSVLEFLKTIPPKKFVSAREILFCMNGKYPTAHQVGKVEIVLMNLWEKYILEERTRVPRKFFRLKQ